MLRPAANQRAPEDHHLDRKDITSEFHRLGAVDRNSLAGVSAILMQVDRILAIHEVVAAEGGAVGDWLEWVDRCCVTFG
jgi:hypothetical protein